MTKKHETIHSYTAVGFVNGDEVKIHMQRREFKHTRRKSALLWVVSCLVRDLNCAAIVGQETVIIEGAWKEQPNTAQVFPDTAEGFSEAHRCFNKRADSDQPYTLFGKVHQWELLLPEYPRHEIMQSFCSIDDTSFEKTIAISEVDSNLFIMLNALGVFTRLLNVPNLSWGEDESRAFFLGMQEYWPIAGFNFDTMDFTYTEKHTIAQAQVKRILKWLTKVNDEVVIHS